MKIRPNVWPFFTIWTVLFLLVIFMSACSQTSRMVVSVTVRAEVAEWIDGYPYRANQVIEWTELALEYLEDNPTINVEDLADAAMAWVPWSRMNARQRVYAEELLVFLEAQFAERLANREIPAAIQARQFLISVRRSAMVELELAEAP